MKTFAIILAVCFIGTVSAGISESAKATLRRQKNECITETGVDVAKVEEAKRGQPDQSDEKLSCFSACLLKKVGVMNADGTFNTENTRALTPSDVPAASANEVIDKCKDLTGETHCDAGRKIFKCYLEHKTFELL